MIKKILQVVVFFTLTLHLNAQRTVGLITHSKDCIDNGYILFTPYLYNQTYLIDKGGKVVHTWKTKFASSRVSILLKDGTLLITEHDNKSPLEGGILEKIDWDGKLIWSYNVSDSLQWQHHDIKPLENGNILIMLSVCKNRQQAIEAGRKSSLIEAKLFSEKIIELQPIGSDSAKIVWEWNLWDHLVQDHDSEKQNYGIISEHPELININYAPKLKSPDWIHLNSIDYNSQYDQILLSSLFFNEIWVIDHSTNRRQAATHKGGNSGKGGDILYRWGNPASYNQGVPAQQKLFGQHNAHWIESGLPYAGNIMIFNNGLNRPRSKSYSSVEIIQPPVNSKGIYSSNIPYMPEKPFWIYGDSIYSNFYSFNYSGAQMLPNGNTIIYLGHSGRFFEINPLRKIVWDYINPVNDKGPVSQGILPQHNEVFRGIFYFKDYSGFKNKELHPGEPIEENPILFDYK